MSAANDYKSAYPPQVLEASWRARAAARVEVKLEVCPRCPREPLHFEEGWAYCERCGGLFCTDEEAQRAMQHQRARADAEVRQ